MELITHVKSNKRRIGIYHIINRVNGKFYIGSSNHIYRRCRRHKNDLISNTHGNAHLQASWNKYGQCQFDFYIVEIISNENDLLIREQYHLNNAPKENVYNLSFSVERTFLTEETKQKISQSLLGKPKTNISKQRLSFAVSGPNNHRYGIPVNPTIYILQHKSGESFVGTQLEFTNKYNMKSGCITGVTSGRRKSLWGWSLASTIASSHI